MKSFEKHIGEQIKNDKLPFEEDPAIHRRLMYHMELLSARSEIRRNSVLPFMNILFSQKPILWKAGIVAIIIAFFIGTNPYKNSSVTSIVADSTQTIKSIDTTSIFFKDTLTIN
jgi:hypothetical protein